MFFATVFAPLFLIAGSGCVPSSFLIKPVYAADALEEKVVRREGAFIARRIAIIDVDGVIQNAAASPLLGGISENPTAYFVEKLQYAADDDRVKAVVLRINSPGGAVTASDLMYDEIKRFRADTGKPIITSMLDVAASGGYYLACATDRVFAMPTTVTGSIGVVMLLPNFSRGLSNIGVEVHAITSADMKDAGSPFRELDAKSREHFQQMVNEMYERFVAVVQRARPTIAAPRIRELADGRVYLGEAAKANGLVDELGGPEEAIAAAKQAVGAAADDPFVIVQYARPYGYKPTVYSQAGNVQQNNVINIDRPLWQTTPQFMYLWTP